MDILHSLLAQENTNMSYSITALDDDQILLMKLDSDFSMEKDGPSLIPDLLAFVEAGPDQIVMLADDRDYAVKHVSEVMAVGSLARTQDAKSLFNHPKLLRIIVITTDKALQLTLKGINTAAFGFFDMSIYSTLEEGLNAARILLYGQRQAN
jgi:hypothetical protein